MTNKAEQPTITLLPAQGNWTDFNYKKDKEPKDRDGGWEVTWASGLVEYISSFQNLKYAHIVKYRPASLPAQEVDCETCCGNGEIVTDWERYKHPHEGDVGDEAVAECPDCDGNGKIEAPSLAAQDSRSREWMIGKVSVDIELALYEKHGITITDELAATAAEAALSAIKGDKS